METITLTIRIGAEEQRLKVPGVESMRMLGDGTLEFLNPAGRWICRVPLACQVGDPKLTRKCEL
jgi:hypothetical protein